MHGRNLHVRPERCSYAHVRLGQKSPVLPGTPAAPMKKAPTTVLDSLHHCWGLNWHKTTVKKIQWCLMLGTLADDLSCPVQPPSLVEVRRHPYSYRTALVLYSYAGDTRRRAFFALPTMLPTMLSLLSQMPEKNKKFQDSIAVRQTCDHVQPRNRVTSTLSKYDYSKSCAYCIAACICWVANIWRILRVQVRTIARYQIGPT